MSWSPLGALAIGEVDGPASYAETLPWSPALAAGDLEPVLIVEIETLEAGAAVTRRYATHGIVTGPYDEPGHVVVPARLIPSLTSDQAAPLTQERLWGGVAGRTVGEAVLANGDGALDALASSVVDGRRVRLSLSAVVPAGTVVREPLPLGPGGSVVPWPMTAERARVAPWRERGLILEVAGDSWQPELQELRLVLQDRSAILRRPLQRSVYAGTGGAEGTADLRDRARPLAFGRCYQVPPVLVDPSYLVYQVHDGVIAGIDGVYDAGVALGEPAVTIAGGHAGLVETPLQPGTWASAPNYGLLRLASPPAGQVTVDLRGAIVSTVPGPEEAWSDETLWSDGTGWCDDYPGPGYVETIAGIVTALLARGGVTRDRIDVGSLADLDVIRPWPCGVFFGPDDRPTVEEAIDRLCRPLGVVASADRTGRYRVTAIELSAVPTPRVITADRILGLAGLLVPYRVPPSAWLIAYQRHWATQSEGEIAGAVEPDRRAELSREWRTVRVEAPAAAAMHPTARAVGPLETPLATEDGARALGAALAALYSPGRSLYRVQVRGLAVGELGDTVRVVHPRLGLDAGRDMVIVGSRLDLGSLTTELQVFG